MNNIGANETTVTGTVSEQLPWTKVQTPTYPDQPDVDYDTAATHLISVKPQSIAAAANSLTTKINDLTDTLKWISSTWHDLKLGWVGKTQQEADQFNAMWLDATTKMFGDPNTPADSTETPPQGQCALGKIQGLVNAAVKTYSNAEYGLAESFVKFGEQLAGTYHEDYWKAVGDLSWLFDYDLPGDVPVLTDPIPPGGKDDGTRTYDPTKDGVQPIIEKT